MILIKLYVKLQLLIIRAIYGKYSAEYHGFYRKIFMKGPYPHCTAESLIHQTYRALFNRTIPSYKTDIPVSFGKVPFESSFQKLRKIKGNPWCYEEKLTKGVVFKVAGYREEVLGMSMRANFYFVNNSFVMGQYLLKDAPLLDVHGIVNTLMSKYGIDATLPEIGQFYISDSLNNTIHFENNNFNLFFEYSPASNSKTIQFLKRFKTGELFEKEDKGTELKDIF